MKCGQKYHRSKINGKISFLVNLILKVFTKTKAKVYDIRKKVFVHRKVKWMDQHIHLQYLHLDQLHL